LGEEVTAPTFVAVGDLMIDVAATGRGHAARIEIAAGGSAANAAVWAAEAGAEARVVARVGDDFAGSALRSALEERGVRLEVTIDPDAATGTFLVADGEIRADRGANARFVPSDLPEPLAADAVLVSGYAPRQTVEAALERAESDWVALAPGFLEDLPPSADGVLIDEDEGQRLTGLDAEGSARALGRTFRLACVTRGAAGAVAVLDERLEEAAAPEVEAGRTVGAGDAFAAGLLIALARGSDLAEALGSACRLGAAAAASPHGWPPLAAGARR
jgi:sugar/nucleoside kinase (ribokinase family)